MARTVRSSAESLVPASYRVRYATSNPKMRKYLMMEPVAWSVAAGQESEVVVELVEGIPVPGKFAAAPEAGQAECHDLP